MMSKLKVMLGQEHIWVIFKFLSILVIDKVKIKCIHRFLTPWVIDKGGFRDPNLLMAPYFTELPLNPVQFTSIHSPYSVHSVTYLTGIKHNNNEYSYMNTIIPFIKNLCPFAQIKHINI